MPRTRRRTSRPAETTTGIVGAIVTLLAYAFHITDLAVLGALPVLVGAVPGCVTWFVEKRYRDSADT